MGADKNFSSSLGVSFLTAISDPRLSASICGWFDLERAVRLELTINGFAIRRLGRLATRARSIGRG
jgi:hypothetical protein